MASAFITLRGWALAATLITDSTTVSTSLDILHFLIVLFWVTGGKDTKNFRIFGKHFDTFY
jgi:hypothetical protein